jgi:hypothetical protein
MVTRRDVTGEVEADYDERAVTVTSPEELECER